MEKVDLQSKFVGAMLGSALGDAIGELAFRFHDRDSLEEAVGKINTLSYTDDTAMAIGLAESIVRKGKIDQEDIGTTFSKNFEREPWRGYASGPPTVFYMAKQSGMAFVDAARRLYGGDGSYGNGAAMRITPVGLFYYDDPDLYDKSVATAEVTHAHPIGKDGAALQSIAVASAVKLDPVDRFDTEKFLILLFQSSKTSQVREKMELVSQLLSRDKDAGIVAHDVGQSVAIHESMPFAIYSFLRYPKNFKECLYCSVLNGGDRDTLGAMACGISGAYLGVEAIPEDWLMKLENREYIEKLAMELVERRRDTNV